MNKSDIGRSPLRWSRPVVQAFFLLLFLHIFLAVSYPLTESLTRNLFFNFDPLILLGMTLSGSIILTGLLFSAVTVALTALFGRFFCGWVCPLGTVYDYSARAIPNRKERPPFGKGRYKNIKYYLLAFFVVGSLFGLTFVLFLDPLVFLMRVFTLNLAPAVILAANGVLNVVRPLAMRMGFHQVSMLSYPQPGFEFALLSLLLFGAVIGLIAVERRFWCRNLCPLGALLSLLSRFSVRGRRVSDACTGCSKCARICPMNAIGDDFKKTSAHECIQCERCASACPVNAISFGFHAPGKQRFVHSPSRRGMILAAAGGVLTAAAAASAVARHTTPPKRLRPPGALVEDDFLDACLRCGECMKACPTHGLQPAMTQAGVEGFFTPVLTPRIGACEEQCHSCGQVCPTGAIRKLPLEEKQYATIGNATIERNLCVAWEQGKICLVCDEICPYDAIEFRMVTDEKGTIQRPFVIEDKCVGCGQCEHACPVNGRAAIYVSPVNEVRKNEGSYITEEAKKLREVKDDEGVDYYREAGDAPVEEAPGFSGGSGAAPEPVAPPDSVTGEDELPPGFVQ